MHRSIVLWLAPRSNMAADGCVFNRTLNRSRTGPTKASSLSPVVCREFVYVVDIQRYSRDLGSTVYFPQTVLSSDDLYDVTLTDGDCRLRVTLDPGLNRLVERWVLQPGSALCHATFSPALSARLPACPGACGDRDSYRLVSADVRSGAEDGVTGPCETWASLPWFGSSEPAGPLVPLRAHRDVFLPLWNNVDYNGEAWTEAPPTEEDGENEAEQEEEEGQRPAVTVSELRLSFVSGRRGVARGAVPHQLIVRITNKSQLMYYGKSDRNCGCPYKAVLEVCDQTGSACAVLWNSACVDWYSRLRPGDIISLRRYRVKQQYCAEAEDIEISVNSRNPAALLSLLPQSSVSPEYVPPAPTYSFYRSKELLDCPPNALCDVIGLLTFTGRPERIRSKDGRGAELLEYRWLRLEDSSSDRPIMVKLFSTSQPETHLQLHPLSVIVCTRVKLIKPAGQCGGWFYLTNSTYTQVYCTGQGHHSQMSYRKLDQVRHFLRWLRDQDDGQVLSRALIGGFFIYPPLPVTLETYMKDRRGELGFLQGAELLRELKQLCYRERRTFIMQATVAMVIYSRRGQEDCCLFWTEGSSSLSSSPLQHLSSSTPPFSCPTSSSSSHRISPSSRPLDHGRPRTSKRKLQLAETPKKRLPQVTLQPEERDRTGEVILFEASMEFLENATDAESDEDDEEDALSFTTAILPPDFSPVAMETLPLRYDHARRVEQARAVAMGGWVEPGRFDSALEDYYTLRLRALSDGVQVDVVFLPHSPPPSSLLRHANTWTSILSHGAFSPHTPPPAPVDLIAMATQLTNQRLMCVLEACHLGGARTELVLSRGFRLTE